MLILLVLASLEERENRLVADRMLHLKQKSLVNSEDRSRPLLCDGYAIYGMGHDDHGLVVMEQWCHLWLCRGELVSDALWLEEQVTRIVNRMVRKCTEQA